MKLEKRDGDRVTTRVIWGPKENAVVGKTVKVEEDNGEWTTGWQVVEVYGEALPEKFVVHQSHAYTRQRKASDI